MRNGDDALTNAYAEYAGLVRGIIFSKTGCFDTAEDLTQEAFIRLHRSAELDQIDNLKSYLSRIAHNLVVDHFRSQSAKHAPREIRTLDDSRDLAADSPSVEEMTLCHEQLSLAYGAVKELSSLCQRIFWLSRAQGFRNQEIASMQRVCLSTVEKNISRATRHCQSRLLESYA